MRGPFLFCAGFCLTFSGHEFAGLFLVLAAIFG